MHTRISLSLCICVSVTHMHTAHTPPIVFYKGYKHLCSSSPLAAGSQQSRLFLWVLMFDLPVLIRHFQGKALLLEQTSLKSF